MTMREMRALEKLVKASRQRPLDSATALKIVRNTQHTQQLDKQAEILKNLNDSRNYQKRGVKFKEIEQFKQDYALSRKDVYAIKSRFMSLEKMSESNQRQTPMPHKANDNALITQMVTTSDDITKDFSSNAQSNKKGGISLKNFLRASPLVKDLDPKVALRLIQALGIDPGNSGQKIDWKHYVELYCILKENNTNNKKLSQFWIKVSGCCQKFITKNQYFDPQSLGIIQVSQMVVMLQDLLKGKSQGAHSWIIHHFSSNFIKRLVIENIVDAEKKIVDLFQLERKFQDIGGKMVEPGMLSKAAGQHEFEDVFNELELTPEQETIFNHVMSSSGVKKKSQQQENKDGVENGEQNRVTFEDISEKQINNESDNADNNNREEGIESQSSQMVQIENVSEE